MQRTEDALKKRINVHCDGVFEPLTGFMFYFPSVVAALVANVYLQG
jgi:hypothetical protein